MYILCRVRIHYSEHILRVYSFHPKNAPLSLIIRHSLEFVNVKMQNGLIIIIVASDKVSET